MNVTTDPNSFPPSPAGVFAESQPIVKRRTPGWVPVLVGVFAFVIVLAGFGLAAGQHPPLSEESREALGDLARFAAATAQEDGDEEDEDAMAELEEFVRVAALLLHGDCVLAPRHRQQFH